MTRKRTTASRVASSRVVDDFKIIRGIGPLYEKHLHDAGIRTFAQLAKLSPEDVATHLPNLSASQIRKQGWVLQSRKLASKKTKEKPRKKKATVPTTSQHYENFTVEFLLNEKNKLRRLRIMHVQSGDVETWTNWKQEEVSHFLARHTGVQFPKEMIQNQEAPADEPKSAVKKTKHAKSVKSKTKQSRSSKRKSAKPAIKASSKDILPKTGTQKVPEARSGQIKSVQQKVKQTRSSAQRSTKPIVKTSPRKTSRKPEKPAAPKAEQEQAKTVQPEIRQSKNTAPILFKPAAEVIPKRFLQKTETHPTPKENIQQPKPSRSKPSQIVKEAEYQTGKIRLLQWNNFMADSDQSVRSMPHDQNFDARLTLDISSLHMAGKSQLEITGTLLAKKLGTREHRVIGKTQVVAPFSPIINLRVGNAALEQGLYRLEAEIKLVDPEAVSSPKGIDTILQGGLFQVY